MATNQDIIKILGIPKSTVYDWAKLGEDDWRRKLIDSLKSMSLEELEAFKKKSSKT